jgi:hypothetical protein
MPRSTPKETGKIFNAWSFVVFRAGRPTEGTCQDPLPKRQVRYLMRCLLWSSVRVDLLKVHSKIHTQRDRSDVYWSFAHEIGPYAYHPQRIISYVSVGVIPLRSIACVSVPTISVPILESGGAHGPYCSKNCQYCHATRRKLILETACHSQREISRIRADPAFEQIRMALKMP